MVRLALLISLLIIPAAFAASGVTDRARPHLPVLRQAISDHWPGAPMPESMAGQVEQESQWKIMARLHTSREDGYGLAQITVTSRFNNLKEAARIKVLKGWNWKEDPYNVRYQLTYLVITDRGNYQTVAKLFTHDPDRWAGALVAYNAGLGTVLQRRALAKATGRENGKWFGGLDAIRLSYESRKLYGRDLGETRNDYPRVILFVRAPKYRGLL